MIAIALQMVIALQIIAATTTIPESSARRTVTIACTTAYSMTRGITVLTARLWVILQQLVLAGFARTGFGVRTVALPWAILTTASTLITLVRRVRLPLAVLTLRLAVPVRQLLEQLPALTLRLSIIAVQLLMIALTPAILQLIIMAALVQGILVKAVLVRQLMLMFQLLEKSVTAEAKQLQARVFIAIMPTPALQEIALLTSTGGGALAGVPAALQLTGLTAERTF